MRTAKRSEAMPFPNGIAAAVVVVVGAINKVPTPPTRNVVSITCSPQAPTSTKTKKKREEALHVQLQLRK